MPRLSEVAAAVLADEEYQLKARRLEQVTILHETTDLRIYAVERLALQAELQRIFRAVERRLRGACN